MIADPRIIQFYEDLQRTVRKLDTWRGYVGYEDDGGPTDDEAIAWLQMGIDAIRWCRATWPDGRPI